MKYCEVLRKIEENWHNERLKKEIIENYKWYVDK